jgi:hypothetical protein
VIIVVVSVVFLGARPVTNPEAKSFARYMIDVGFSVLWIGFSSSMLYGLFFGTLMS